MVYFVDTGNKGIHHKLTQFFLDTNP